MKDRITEFEFEIDYSKVVDILQAWAAEAKFTVHETTGKRILYKQNHALSATNWVLFENLGEKTRLSAWFAPKSLSPDQDGSFWKGNKQPIPLGFGFGSIGRFKKKFNNLLDRINDASTGESVSLTIQKLNPTWLSKEEFAKGLVFLAILSLINGVMSVFYEVHPIFNQLSPSFRNTMFQQGIIDLVLGIVLFSTSRLMKSGKALSIWLYGATVLFSVGHDIVRGANFPFLTVIFGVWIMSQLLGLKRQGQLV